LRRECGLEVLRWESKGLDEVDLFVVVGKGSIGGGREGEVGELEATLWLADGRRYEVFRGKRVGRKGSSGRQTGWMVWWIEGLKTR
jgi:hypothetical protein